MNFQNVSNRATWRGAEEVEDASFDQEEVVIISCFGPEGGQDISRAVITAREKPRRLFPRTQGFLRCSCKENEMVDKK